MKKFILSLIAVLALSAEVFAEPAALLAPASLLESSHSWPPTGCAIC